MKTIQLIVLGLICSFYAPSVNAQTIWIYDYFDDAPGPTNLAGTVVYAIPEGTIKRFYIKNTSLEAFNFRIERVKIEETVGVSDFFACGSVEPESIVYDFGMVSPHDSFMTPDTFLLALDEDAYLGSHYLPGDSGGCSQYRYYVVNDSTERIDSVDVRYCSASDLPENQLDVSVYPNPAQDRIVLKSDNSISGTLVITDITGRMVYHNQVANLSKVEMDLSFLEGGIYAITLIDPVENEQIFSTKLVLQ